MRNAICMILFIFSSLALVATIIGVISPSKFVRSGQAVPKRIQNLLSGLFVTCILLIAAIIALPKVDELPANTPKIADVELIKTVQSEINEIENQATNQQNAISKELVKLSKMKNISPTEQVNEARRLFDSINDTLEKSKHIKIPDLVNVDAKKHLSAAVKAHRNWSVAHQTKHEYLLRNDFSSAKKMMEEADNFAIQEAISIAMAYESVGVKFK